MEGAAAPVLNGLVAGHPNKVIAHGLGICARTVEIYRANVMTKMQATSLSPAVRDSLKFSLGVEGFEVRAYASPDELLNDNSLPASGCLIAHYHLPTMNGLEVIAKIRARRNSMPALLMTGRPNANIRKRALAAGIRFVLL